MEGRTLAWIGITLTVISGWDKIAEFINSILNGFNNLWKTIPPVIQLGLIIWLFWWIGNKNR